VVHLSRRIGLNGHADRCGLLAGTRDEIVTIPSAEFEENDYRRPRNSCSHREMTPREAHPIQDPTSTSPRASSRVARPKDANTSVSWNTELRLMPSAVTVKIWRVCSSYSPPTRR
jgi:hypothetical protein